MGGKKTRIVAKLCNVPILLGQNNVGEEPYRTTFYVLDSDDYHWILGLPLLAQIQGSVQCKDRTLTYLPAGQTDYEKIAMISRRGA